KQRDEFTATWVKGKYYNKPATARFMIATNNIPTPSRGYLITADCHQCLGKAPGQELYKLIRKATEDNWEDAALLERGSELGFRQDLERLFKTPRDILGLDFNPFKHGYVERHRELFRQMMDRFIELNEDAFDKGL